MHFGFFYTGFSSVLIFYFCITAMEFKDNKTNKTAKFKGITALTKLPLGKR